MLSGAGRLGAEGATIANSRRCLAAGIALSAAVVAAAVPMPRSGPSSPVFDIDLTAESIVIDFVRHGRDEAPHDSRVALSPYPGAPLSETGQQQAQDTANQLFGALGGPHGVAGIFSGHDLDAQQTAAPFLTLQDMAAQILPGLNEIDGGIYADLPTAGPAGILYQLTVFSWVLGLQFVPMPGSPDFNGVAFDQTFGGAVQSIYDDVVNTGVVSDNDQTTAVAFSSEAAITAWVLMNAENPDLSFFVPRFLAGRWIGRRRRGRVAVVNSPAPIPNRAASRR